MIRQSTSTPAMRVWMCAAPDSEARSKSSMQLFDDIRRSGQDTQVFLMRECRIRFISSLHLRGFLLKVEGHVFFKLCKLLQVVFYYTNCIDLSFQITCDMLKRDSHEEKWSTSRQCNFFFKREWKFAFLFEYRVDKGTFWDFHTFPGEWQKSEILQTI